MTRSTLARTLSPTCWMLLMGLPSATAPAVVLPCRGPDGLPGVAVTSRNGIGAQATSLPPRQSVRPSLDSGSVQVWASELRESFPRRMTPLLHQGVETGENVQISRRPSPAEQ